MTKRNETDQLQTVDSAPKITKEQAARVREHARHAAMDDAEYQMFLGMLLGEN